MKAITTPIDKKTERFKQRAYIKKKPITAPPEEAPKEIVAVRDYVTGKGYSGAVDWDGTNPTVGGIAITPQYIENGVAYVNREDADNAIKEMEKRAGIIGMDGAEKARDEKYGDAEDKALKKVTDREEFSYDAENDPVFQAYRNMYEREAEEAYRRVLNDNNTSVTGASNVVLAEAMAAQNNELKKIADIVPELYSDAYDRYLDTADMDRESLEAISELADSFYDRLYNQNLDATDRLIEAGTNERKEKQRWVDNAQTDKENEREDTRAFYENALKGIEIEKGNIELDTYDEKIRNEINSDNAVNESRAMDNAIARGFFIESDEAIMPWLSEYRNDDGTYSITPQMAALSYEYQVYHTRERAKINAKLGR